jgi:hypothetical protein
MGGNIMIRPLPFVFAAIAILLFAGQAAANPIEVPVVTEVQFEPAQDVSLCMVPDGSGTSFAAAWDGDGHHVDATIRVQLSHEWGPEWPEFPAEDIWLGFYESPTNVTGCLDVSYYDNAFYADGDSDELGMVEWTLPWHGGGWSTGPVTIYIYGGPAMYPDYSELPPLPLRVNSPDISGDLVVDLTDVALFVQDLGGPYHYRSDFCWDGVIDLSDIAIFVQGMGAVCP